MARCGTVAYSFFSIRKIDFTNTKDSSCEEKNFVIDRMKSPTFSCVSLDTQSRYMTRDREAISSVSLSQDLSILYSTSWIHAVSGAAHLFAEKKNSTAISRIVTRNYGDIPFLTIRYSILDAF